MIGYIDLIKTMIIAFLITLIIGPTVIKFLNKNEIGQSIREDGPQSHLSKTGTPTMGGIIIFIGLVITVFTSGYLTKEMNILILATFAFGLIGFIDDFIIVVMKRNLGLRAHQKLIGQILFAVILAVYQWNTSTIGTKVIIPFMDKGYLDLGIFYIPFIVFVVVGTVNSVNLTDGLDGLASGVTLIVLSFFGFIAFKWAMGSISIFSIALAGACLGFLVHNAYPAKIFMGDTGSMALGGAVAAIAVILNLPLVLPIVGGIYFLETLSVIIQVLWFKLTGKRVFLMSPLHHHFEHKGWKETTVVIVFYIVTVIFCLIGVVSLL